MIRKLMVVCVMATCLFGMTYENSGNLEYNHITCKKDVAKVNKKKKWKAIQRFEAIVNNDFHWENISLKTSLGYIKTDESIYNNISKGPVFPIELTFINDMYIAYRTGSYTIYSGMFSFRKGMLYEYGFNDYRVGNGIYSIITNELQGILLKKRFQAGYSIMGGTLYSDKFVDSIIVNNSDSRVEVEAFKGTKVDILSYKKSSELYKEQADLYVVDRKILGKNIGKVTVLSYAGAYSTEEFNGMLYYGLVSGSYTKGNNSGLSPTGKAFETNSAYFGEYSATGWKAMLGIRKTFDLESITREVVAGGEYSHVKNGYMNLTVGKPIEPYNYSLLGDTYNAYVGIRWNRQTMFKLRYCVYNNNNIQYKSGMSTKLGNTEDMFRGSRKLESLTVQLYINF